MVWPFRKKEKRTWKSRLKRRVPVVLILAGGLFAFIEYHGYTRTWVREGIYLGMEERPKSNQLSSNSKEVLLINNLLDLFEKNPEEACVRFVAMFEENPMNRKNPEMLFAGAELANVMGERSAPFFNRRPLVRPKKIRSIRDDEGPITAVGKYFSQNEEALRYYDWALHFSTEYLLNASDHLSEEAYDPRFRAACDIYNYSLEQILRFLLNQNAFSNDYFVRIKGPQNVTRIEFDLKDSDWPREDIHDLLIAGDYRPKRSGPISTWEGLGVSLMGIRYNDSEKENEPYPDVCAFPLTALFAPENDFEFHELTSWDKVLLVEPWQGRFFEDTDFEFPLEADLTTPLRYTLDKTGFNAHFKKLRRFIGDKNYQKGRVFLIRPHVAGRIPIVMCHGLLSSPGPWESLINGLMKEKWFRQNFEFWFMEYPTGIGFMTNAMYLRESLRRLREDLDPQGLDLALDNVVLVGHSMGGIMCRLLTQPSENFLWDMMWKEPMEKLDLTEEEKEGMRKRMFFEPLPFVKQVFFMGSPHKGTPFAYNTISRLGRKLIRIPEDSASLLESVYTKNIEHASMQPEKDHFTSVGQLKEDSPIYEALKLMRPDGKVTFHNILGDISKEGEEPHDGVVPERSGRVDWASTTLIVPAAHSGIQSHPLAIRQIKKILKRHAEEVKSRTVADASKTAG